MFLKYNALVLSCCHFDVSRDSKKALFCLGLSLILTLSSPVYAQVESNFAAGGGVKIGYSGTACDASIAGAIRYNSGGSGSIDFCNGTTWENIGAAGGSVAIGDLLDAKTDYIADHNLFMGLNAGMAIQAGGQYNLAIGALAGDAITTGDENIAIGYDALGKNSTGTLNIAIGRNALADRTANTSTIAIGRSAGFNTGNNTVAIGNYAASGSSGAGGSDSIIIGYHALRYRQGNQNVAIGTSVLSNFGANSHSNVAIGYQAFDGADPSPNVNQNVGIGWRAGRSLRTGSNNTLLGYMAGNDLTIASGNILIGASATAPTVTANDHLNIGNLIYGDMSVNKYVGINTAAPAYTLHVTGDIAYTGVTTDISDRRRKDGITPLPPALSRIMALKPVSFTMKDDADKQKEYGFIAQDVQDIYPALVNMADDADRTLSMNYIGLIAPLVKAVQEQQQIIEKQQARLEALEKRDAP